METQASIESQQTSTRRHRRGRLAAIAAVTIAALSLAACTTGESGTELASSGQPKVQSSTGERSSTEQIADGTDDGQGETVDMVHRVGESADPSRDTGNWATMYEFMEYVTLDADRFWSPVLMSEGRPEPQVSYLFPQPGESYANACVATDDNSMFYCPLDDQIVFSQSIATRLWDGSYVGPDGQQIGAPGGDFAVAFLLAHEFAHSIQNEVGISKAVYGTPATEKHADCWAGVWTQHAEREGILDANDVTEGWNAAWVVGDSQFESSDHHGTPEQRQEAFWAGYSSSSPVDCDVFLQ